MRSSRWFVLSLPPLLMACGGGGNSITGMIDETISEIVLVGGPTSFGRINVIPSVDDVSPQSFSVSAGFGDEDEIEKGASVSISDGRLLIDVRRVEARLDRSVRVGVSARTPRYVEFVGIADGRLSLSPIDSIETIRVRDGASVKSTSGLRLPEANVYIEVDSATFEGEFRVGSLDVNGSDAQLGITGTSDRLRMSLVDSRQLGGFGGEAETSIDAVRSDVSRICAFGPLSITAREGTRVVYSRTCPGGAPSLSLDSSSSVEESDL
ncbi:MAG: hypothetical protein AAGJ19_00010 [Myxococcota bacterium]